MDWSIPAGPHPAGILSPGSTLPGEPTWRTECLTGKTRKDDIAGVVAFLCSADVSS